jgi:hypothetical protein
MQLRASNSGRGDAGDSRLDAALFALFRPGLRLLAQIVEVVEQLGPASPRPRRVPSITLLARDHLAAVPVAAVDIRDAEPDQVNRSALEPAFHQLEDDQRRARPVLVAGALLCEPHRSAVR